MVTVIMFFCFFIQTIHCMTDTHIILEPGQKVVVTTPVTTLWTQTTGIPRSFNYSALLDSTALPCIDTQLLLNETAQVIEYTSGWIKVRACEQQQFNRTTRTWGCVEGWINACDVTPVDTFPHYNAVVCAPNTPIINIDSDQSHDTWASIGTLLECSTSPNPDFNVNPEANYLTVTMPNTTKRLAVNAADIIMLEELHQSTDIRSRLAQQAKNYHAYIKNINPRFQYTWGGRSCYRNDDATILTGMDCSGFTNLMYRSCGLAIPRDAHPQYEKAQTTNPCDLQVGDLLFLKSASSNFTRVNHVLMYLGNDEFIEAHGKTISQLQIISTHDRFGCLLSSIHQGMTVTSENEEVVLFGGSFISSPELLETIRIKPADQ